VETRPKKGRQAEAARNDRKVLEAARSVFATQGWNAPVAAIATQAGVGMGTLYRRYGSKSELLQYLCVLSMRQAIDAGNAALALEDPWDSLVDYIEACVTMSAGAFSAFAGVIEATEEMITTAKKSNHIRIRLVESAHRTGQLRPDVTDTDIWWLIEQFSRHSANPDSPEDPCARARVLAIAIDGLRPQVGRSLPGPAPDRHSIARRWTDNN